MAGTLLSILMLAGVLLTGGGIYAIARRGDRKRGALMIIALVLVAALTFVLLTQPWVTRWYTLALSAILGGAVGNLVDRVRLGAVTDFIDPTHYPAFNIADSAIVVGIGAILLLSFIEERRA